MKKRILNKADRLPSASSQGERESDTACPYCRREIDPARWIRTGGQLSAAMRRTVKTKTKYDRSCPHCQHNISLERWTTVGARLAVRMRKANPPNVFTPQMAVCPHCNSERPSKLELRYVHAPTCDKNPRKREGDVANGRPCKWCRQIKGAMELRYHEPRCENNPNPQKGALNT